MKNVNDFEIIDSVIAGNHSDYRFLIDRYKNKAFGMLRRMLRNDADAEEVLQDCFLKAYKNLSGFNRKSKFSTWFFRIVYNTALNRINSAARKQEKERTDLESLDNFHFGEQDNLSELEEKKELITKLVNQLPLKYSAVVTLFYLEEQTIEEIAGIMNMTESNVKVMLFRARKSLKDYITQNNLEGELR